MKSILIIEPKLIHWTTVEPLIIYYLKKDWKVTVIIPVAFKKIMNTYISIHNIEEKIKNLSIIEYERFSPLHLFRLKKKPNLSIVADRFFYEKPINLPPVRQAKNYIRLVLLSIKKYIAIIFFLEKSNLIVTTHFVDAAKHNISKLMTKNTFVNYFLIKVWTKGFSARKATNVYSSLVKKNYSDKFKKPVFVAPNAIFRNSTKLLFNQDRKISIVIPGRIDLRRRDYNWIDNLDKDWIKDIDIKMVGRANTEDELRVVKRLEEKGFNQVVKKANQFIAFKEFDFLLDQADLFFVPFVKLNNQKREIDRNLGSYFDSVRYGKPILIPKKIISPPELNNNIVTYSGTSELLVFFKKIISNTNFLKSIKDSAYKNSLNWSVNKISYFNQLEKEFF